MNPQSEQQLQH